MTSQTAQVQSYHTSAEVLELKHPAVEAELLSHYCSICCHTHDHTLPKALQVSVDTLRLTALNQPPTCRF